MVILTNFHPSLEEKQKFQRLRVAECKKANIYNSAINEKKCWQRYVVDNTGSQNGDFYGQITKNYKERERTIFQVNNVWPTIKKQYVTLFVHAGIKMEIKEKCSMQSKNC